MLSLIVFISFEGAYFYIFVAKNSNAFENVYVLVLILNDTLNICYSFITDCPQGFCPQYIQRPTLSIKSHISPILGDNLYNDTPVCIGVHYVTNGNSHCCTYHYLCKPNYSQLWGCRRLRHQLWSVKSCL